MKNHLRTACLLLLVTFPGEMRQLFGQQLLAFGKSTEENPVLSQDSNNLISLLTKLEQKHHTSFVYEKSLLENKTFGGTIKEDERLETILKKVLPAANLRYKKLKGGGYAILPDQPAGTSPEMIKTPVPQANESSINIPLPGMAEPHRTNTISGNAVMALEKTVKGTVTDNTGSGLPGVSIVIKGSQRGTTTGSDGKYSLAIPEEYLDNGSAILSFSFVGYVPREVAVGTKTTIDVQLEVDTKSLEELVVVGYGTVKKAP